MSQSELEEELTGCCTLIVVVADSCRSVFVYLVAL